MISVGTRRMYFLLLRNKSSLYGEKVKERKSERKKTNSFLPRNSLDLGSFI